MISKELQEVYASAPHNVKFVETLEFSHSKFSKTYYFTNDIESWDFTLENGNHATFEAIPFELQLPTKDTSGNQDLSINICNVGEEMMSAIEAANVTPQETIRVVYRVYLDQPNSKPQNDPPMELFITDITANLQTVSAVGTRFDVLNRLFPNKIYTTDEFPALKR